MSWLEKFNWKPLTPGRLPAGARISAGKSGNVEMSLPIIADVLVNCVPVSCMPSPESPAKRMVTVSSSSRCLSMVSIGGSMTALMINSACLFRLVCWSISHCQLPIVRGGVSIGNHQLKIDFKSQISDLKLSNLTTVQGIHYL